MKAGKRTRGGAALALLGLFVAAGCGDEVGGDGFVPDSPAGAGKAGSGSGGDATPAGGMMDQGGAPSDMPTSGKGGKGSGGRGGSAGKSGGGTGGGVVTEGGMGGETGTPSVCGNNVIEPGEDCDDGNTKSFDGCPTDCHAACEVCEKTFCKAVRSHDAGEFNWTNDFKKNPYDLFTTCQTLAGMAATGPGQGVARADLCQALVNCARQEQCAQLVPDNPPPPAARAAATFDFVHCFCTFDVTVVDPGFPTACGDHGNFDPMDPKNLIGKCKREFQEAAEADTEAAIFGGLTNGAKALGVGNSLLQLCDRTLCTEECLPQASIGTLAQISADILVAKNEAGESAIGDLIADAERAATGTDFAFVNDGTFKSDYGAPGLLFHAAPGRAADAEGRVLESEVRQLVFGMNGASGVSIGAGRLLMTLKLSGQGIYDYLSLRVKPALPEAFLQVSGLTYTWDATAHLVTEVKRDGNLIDKAATYSITVNDYFAQSNIMAAGATDVVTTDKNPVQELVKYLKAQPQPIAPPTLNRISLAQ